MDIAPELAASLAGLVLVEAEFRTPQRMASVVALAFASREITDAPRFTGAALAERGLPADLAGHV